MVSLSFCNKYVDIISKSWFTILSGSSYGCMIVVNIPQNNYTQLDILGYPSRFLHLNLVPDWKKGKMGNSQHKIQ